MPPTTTKQNIFSQPTDTDALRLTHAIALQESGKGGKPNYDAVGDNGTSHGAYQWQPGNFEAAAKEAGLDPADRSSTNQDKVAYFQVKKYKDQGLDPGQIASTWNSGSPNNYKDHAGVTVINGKSIKYDTPAYVKGVQNHYKSLLDSETQKQAPTSDNQPPPDTRGGLEKFTDFIGGKGLTDYLSSAIAKTMVPKEQQNLVKDASGKAAIGSALQLGSLVLPYGAAAKGIGLAAEGLGLGAKAASLAGRVGSGAVGGYLNDVGSGLQQDKSLGESLTPGIGTAVGAAIPSVGLGIGALKRAATPIKSGAQAVENMLTKNAAGAIDTGAGKTLSSLEQQRLGAAGKIVQGNTREAEVAARTLPKVDTTGVKTYSDLSSRLDENISSKVKQVESEFASDSVPRKLSTLTQTVTNNLGTKSLTGKVNYVRDSLKQLGELYKKTRDLPSALRIKALGQKAQTKGLTPSEINNLAKEYGSNFRSKGFSKTGEALTSVNDQAFENTRRGLKDTARGFLKGDAAKMADKEASDLIKTKELTDKMVEKVNKLSQRIQPRNPIQKLGRAAGQAIDMATFGGPKAFVTKLLFPSGVGEKQLTSLDIQDLLQKNLKLLNRIEKAPNSAVPKLLEELISKAGLNSLPRSPGDMLMRK